MKTWLIVVSAVAVLLVASTGVGFWMFMDVKAELNDTRAELTDAEFELTDTKAEITGIQKQLDDNFGYWSEGATGEYPWEEEATAEYPWREGTTGGKYPWCEGIEVTIRDLELKIEELERTVEGLEWQLWELENTLYIHGIY